LVEIIGYELNPNTVRIRTKQGIINNYPRKWILASDEQVDKAINRAVQQNISVETSASAISASEGHSIYLGCDCSITLTQ